MILGLITASELPVLIGKAAQTRRVALGLTQRDLADRSGVPLSTLKRFE